MGPCRAAARTGERACLTVAGSFTAYLAPHLIIARPNGTQFGHLGLELLMAFAEARRARARLVLVEPPDLVNRALFHLRPEGVRVFRWPRWTSAVVLPRLWMSGWRSHARVALRQASDAVRDEAAETLRWHLGRTPMPQALQRRLRQAKSALGRRSAPPRGYVRVRETYYRRQLIRTPISVALPAGWHDMATALAQRVGIPKDRPIVTIHTRESGFKSGGREVHEKHDRERVLGVRDDSLRNSSIEDYRPAVALLRDRGFCVVRLGDSTMAPLDWPGVVDLTTLTGSDAVLQVYCLMRSRFLIAGESGPTGVSMLTNTPVLTVNATDPIGSYPIRRASLVLLKRIIDRATRQTLSPFDLLTDEYYTHLRDPVRFEYTDNTPDELVRAVTEIVERLDGCADTVGQERFREAATHAAESLRDRFAYVRKWGTDDEFLGDGGIAAFSVSA
jgi:putative glycosyltransferase (TIGR04372 family)